MHCLRRVPTINRRHEYSPFCGTMDGRRPRQMRKRCRRQIVKARGRACSYAQKGMVRSQSVSYCPLPSFLPFLLRGRKVNGVLMAVHRLQRRHRCKSRSQPARKCIHSPVTERGNCLASMQANWRLPILSLTSRSFFCLFGLTLRSPRPS